ncbi:MAG: ceramidase domain-containing protein [Bacteroidetes bacterium]|nr:ceramidase domain-containing protein [Bacteroidota bacterium]
MLVGILGLMVTRNFRSNKLQYIVFFLGISLVSFGSAYYHFNPKSQSLVWDRLPMTLAFMALFSIIISEFIKKKGK